MVLLAPSQPPRAQPNPPPAVLPYILLRPQSRTFYLLQIQFYTAALISHFTDSIPANRCSFPVEIPGDSRGRFKFPPFYIQLPSLKAEGMQGVNLVECCQTLFS